MSLEKVIYHKAKDAFSIYPVIAPANAAYPFVVWECTGNTPNHTKDEKSKFDYTTVAFTSYAKSFKDLKTLTALVRSTFDNISGSQTYFTTGTTTSTYNIEFFRWDDESNAGFDPETEAFVMTSIFRIGHNIGN